MRDIVISREDATKLQHLAAILKGYNALLDDALFSDYRECKAEDFECFLYVTKKMSEEFSTITDKLL